MSLVQAEWKRFFARRFVRVMLLVVLLMLIAVAIGTAHSSHQITPAVRAHARQQVEQATSIMHQQLADCQKAQADGDTANPQYVLPPGMTCEDSVGVTDPPQEQWFLPGTWVFATDARDALLIFAGLFALFAFATGASFIGAEWSSGGMMNLMLWRPRRLTLLGQKLLALLTAELAVGIVLGAIWTGMLMLIAETRGSFGHMTSGVIQSMLLDGARILTLGLFTAAVGFAIASIGRHTAAALGTAVGYVIVVEIAGRLLLNGLGVIRPERFIPSNYVLAWLSKAQTYYNGDICRTTGNATFCQPGGAWTIRPASAVEVLSIVLVVLLVWAFVTFRRRDV